MRKHLAQDFTKIYHIDLKGNARTSGERRRKEGGNVFDDQIRVGVGISFFIKKADATSGTETEVWIYSVDDYLKAREKQKLLTDFRNYTNVPMKKATIDAKHTWLTEGLHIEFNTFIPMGTKEAKAAKGTAVDVIFKNLQPRSQYKSRCMGLQLQRKCSHRKRSAHDGILQSTVLKWLVTQKIDSEH